MGPGSIERQIYMGSNICRPESGFFQRWGEKPHMFLMSATVTATEKHATTHTHCSDQTNIEAYNKYTV